MKKYSFPVIKIEEFEAEHILAISAITKSGNIALRELEAAGISNNVAAVFSFE